MSLPLQGLTLALIALAVSIFALLDCEGSLGLADAAWWISQVALMSAGAWQLRRRFAVAAPPQMSVLLVVLAVAALGWEAVSRAFFGAGRPFEIIVMAVLRNVLIGLGLVSAWRHFQPMTIVLCLFLALFGATAARNPQAQVVAAVFAALAVIWLATSHWESLHRHIAAGSQRSHFRRLLLSAGIAVLLSTTAFISVGHDSMLRSLKGFMPSSGGDSRQSEHARDGIGDGEMLVAGTENIRSFGPIEDAPFMTDDKPSLYDVFDDRYEEPVRPNQQQDRAVALDRNALVEKPSEHIHTESQKAQREFTTHRKPRGRSSLRMQSISSDALFYVAGRVPLHLRMEAYDEFDGVVWRSTGIPSNENVEIVRIADKPWLRLADNARLRSDLCEAETHALKVVRFDSNVIPLPLNAHGVHIDRVDRADLYTVESDSRVRLNRKTLPELVPIHVASRAVDRRRTERSISTDYVDTSEDWPEQLDFPKWRSLAVDWTQGCTSRLAKIQAIEARLQNQYLLDDEWRAAPTSTAPVDDFLFTSKRGADYHFATSAALLLRTLGYRTRVISGFYADDRGYDATAGHTPVKAKDVHLWAEVALVGKSWFTVEATPGYRVLGPVEGWMEWLRRQFWEALAWCRQNWFLMSWVLGLSGALFAWRRSIADAADELLWVVVKRRQPHAALSAFSLLERRAARAGRPRPGTTSAACWLKELKAGAPREVGSALESLAMLVDRAAFGPPGLLPNESSVTEMIDPNLSRQLSLRWFRRRAFGTASSRGDKAKRSLPTSALVLAGALTLPLFLASGCRGEAAEHEHLEHVHPAHKSADLNHAVDQLRQRLASPTIRSSEQESTELLDIVRWLPELAGATDLKKAEWEEVLSISKQLERHLADPQATAQDAAMAALMSRLQDLSTKTKRTWNDSQAVQ